MSVENKLRIGFILFWAFMLGVSVTQGKTVWAIVDVLFMSFNAIRLYQEYEAGNL